MAQTLSGPWSKRVESKTRNAASAAISLHAMCFHTPLGGAAGSVSRIPSPSRCASVPGPYLWYAARIAGSLNLPSFASCSILARASSKKSRARVRRPCADAERATSCVTVRLPATC